GVGRGDVGGDEALAEATRRSVPPIPSVGGRYRGNGSACCAMRRHAVPQLRVRRCGCGSAPAARPSCEGDAEPEGEDHRGGPGQEVQTSLGERTASIVRARSGRGGRGFGRRFAVAGRAALAGLLLVAGLLAVAGLLLVAGLLAVTGRVPVAGLLAVTGRVLIAGLCAPTGRVLIAALLAVTGHRDSLGLRGHQ